MLRPKGSVYAGAGLAFVRDPVCEECLSPEFMLMNGAHVRAKANLGACEESHPCSSEKLSGTVERENQSGPYSTRKEIVEGRSTYMTVLHLSQDLRNLFIHDPNVIGEKRRKQATRRLGAVGKVWIVEKLCRCYDGDRWRRAEICRNANLFTMNITTPSFVRSRRYEAT